MKKVAICGTSHFCLDHENQGTHFSEIVAKNYNSQLIVYSRDGVSNNTIALQIEQAISEKVDFIIIGLGYYDRIDIPIEQDKKLLTQFFDSYMNFFNLRDQKNYKQYSRENLLSNIDYSKYNNSSRYDFLQNPCMISESINNLIFTNNVVKYDLSKNTINAIKSYVMYMYDAKFKQQIDCWVINNILRKLVYETKINFLLFPYPIFTKEFVEELKWLDKKFIANIKGPYNLKEEYNGPNRYHTSDEVQHTIAKQLIKIIDERFLTNNK